MSAAMSNTTPERPAYEVAVREAEAATTALDRETATINGEIRKLERDAGASVDGEAAAVKLIAAKARLVGLARQRTTAATRLDQARSALELHVHGEAVARERQDLAEAKAQRMRVEADDLSRRLRASALREDGIAEAMKADLVRMIGSDAPLPITEAQRLDRLIERDGEARR